MKSSRLVASALLACLCVGCGTSERQDGAIEVKAVVVTMFEVGSDSGDAAGEFQLWHEGAKLNERMPFAHGHDLYLNRTSGVLGMVTGEGTANAATAITQLGLDPRFDLSHAYWLVAAVRPVSTQKMRLSAPPRGRNTWWTETSPQGIDAREIPPDWSTGYFGLGTDRPYDTAKPEATTESWFRLNSGLVEWAYQLTRNVKLKDTAGLQKERAAVCRLSECAEAPIRTERRRSRQCDVLARATS